MRLVKVLIVALPLLVIVLAASGVRHSAYSLGQSGTLLRPAPIAAMAPYTPEVKIEVRDGYRYITSNGIPNHSIGPFPNANNPNSIAPQDYHFRVPLTPTPGNAEYRGEIFGVAVNGVVFDPGTAELWNGDPRWHYEALTGFLGGRGKLGLDENNAHVQPSGAYHYHGLPMGLLEMLDYTHKMALIGYAADGYPIYGPDVPSDPNDLHSPLKQVHSGYRVKDGERPGGADGPGGAYDGSFASDYGYVPGTSDLDKYNGRTGVTPEYPKGTYYYVLTDNWPFVPRQFRGVPDPSFGRRPEGRPSAFNGPGPGGGPSQGGGFGPPGGGPGGPGGFGGPGGGPPANMVPADVLAQYLDLTPAQTQKLARLMRAMDVLRQEGFAPPALGRLKLTEDQVRRIASGQAVRSVLTAVQKKIFNANRRPAFGGPGGFGGPPPGGGGFGGPPPGGGFGGPGPQ